LLLETPTGLVDVAGLAPEFGTASDVKALLETGPRALATLAEIPVEGADDHHGLADLSPAPPVIAPDKLICIGLNYRKHAEEGGDPLPDKPIIFAKLRNTLVGSGSDIRHPRITDALDYEGELGLVIGQTCRDVTPEEALSKVAGYVVANDITARDLQSNDPGSQWVRGKSLDGFAPVGPYFVSADAVPDWRALRIQTWVNDELRQDEVCGDMIFGVEELVSFVSADLTLVPGDLILTGTPSGVGSGFDPPRWLVPGDTVEIEITGLGRLSSRVVAAEE
jgi:2-keto-4-pentenoate hydratase/2-oxohepta-3-ene-1,7-dioic acid hydratase in catechol pathway